MPQYILLSISPNLPPEQVIGADLTPELIQTIIQKYNDWTAQLHATGKLKGLNKLRDDLGRQINGFGEGQIVTDGPFAETKEVVGGYWIVEAASYDEAVKLASRCPSLEYGGTVEVREVEGISIPGVC